MSISTTNSASANIYQQLGLTGNSSSTSGSSTTSGSGALDASAFLNLMVTELQNQDPTQPIDAQNMLAQLAQFSTVSGVQSLESTVSNLAGSLSTTQSLQAASLVGRQVLVPASQANLPSSGTLNGAVSLSSSAQQVSVGIYDSSGVLVRQIDLGTQPTGLAKFSWDGNNSSGTPAPAGVYTLKAEGVVNGQTQALSTLAEEQVGSVTLGQSGGAITLGLANGAGSVDLSQVQQIS